MTDLDEHFKITLQVANRVYPIVVKRRDEEAYRRANTEINFKLEQYKSYYTSGTSQQLEDADYIAMTAIQAVAEKAKVDLRAENLRDKLEDLNNQLDEYISKNVI